MPARAPVRLPRRAEQLLVAAGVDWEPPIRQPVASRVVLATVVALAGSLAAAALLVALGTHLFPATRGFAHFRPSDYGSLTVVGVLAACAGWPVVTRVSSAPRRLYFRLAVLVTLVLLLPDPWILLRGEPARAVGVLVAMHLAVALVTYNIVVSVAPAGRRRQSRSRRHTGTSGGRHPVSGRSLRSDVAESGTEPVRRDTAYPSHRTGPAYGPDGVAIAVPVEAAAGPGTTALPNARAAANGTAGAAFVASVVPVRPKAAPPVGGSSTGGASLHPRQATGRVTAPRRLETDDQARAAVANAVASPSRIDTRTSAAPEPGTAAERADRRSKRERPAANVARPPATVAEPRSAVRLIPSQSGAGADPISPVGRALGDQATADGGPGIGPPPGRHARRTSDDAGMVDGSGDHPGSTARWRRAQRGRHVARS